MTIDDLVPHEFLTRRFEMHRDGIQSEIDIPIRVTLVISGKYTLNASSSYVVSDDSYQIVVTRRLIDFLTLSMFALARSAPDFGGIPFASESSPGVTARSNNVDSIEEGLHLIPRDADLAEDRTEFFLRALCTAWDFVLLHEFAHIKEGHLKFKVLANLEDFASTYSWACEVDADFQAIAILMTMPVSLPLPVVSAGSGGNGEHIRQIDFVALIIFILLDLFRLCDPARTGAKANNHPHLILRLFIVSIHTINPRHPLQSSVEEIAGAMTESIRLLTIMLGGEPRKKPTIVLDRSIDEINSSGAQLLRDVLSLAPHWQVYRH